MRLKIQLVPVNPKEVILPCNYNHLLQGLIYNQLDDYLATHIHDEGFKEPVGKRKLKLFTFSRLIPEEKPMVRDKKIIFNGPIYFVVCSPDSKFIQSFATNLLKKGKIYLESNLLEVISINLEPTPNYRKKVIVRALSPITVYSTVKTPDGRKKTYYYNPFEKEFEDLLLKNLLRKLSVWTGKIMNLSEKPKDCYIKPYKVSKRNERIIIYKDTVIKGWDGLYELKLSPELFQIAFDAGLGAKNSQGFGCVEFVK